VTICAFSIQAAEPYSANAVKAAFIYRFPGYMEWPAESLHGPVFVIGVFGADDMLAELQKLPPDRFIQNLPVEVRRITSMKNLGDIHVLYVGPGRAIDARAVIMAFDSRPILVITDEERGLASGSSINFLTVDRRIRFEVSLPAAEAAKLKVGSDMLSAALRLQRVR
jgi:hypothetical protein